MNSSNTPPSKEPTFVVVDGGDDLTVESRSCLLRAAKKELRHLQAELYRLQNVGHLRHMQGPIEATESEIECLGKGITWLWRTRPPP